MKNELFFINVYIENLKCDMMIHSRIICVFLHCMFDFNVAVDILHVHMCLLVFNGNMREKHVHCYDCMQEKKNTLYG